MKYRKHLLARAVVVEDDHVLLTQARGREHTFLPGGHVESDESIVDGLHREFQEELGVDIQVGAYLGAVEDRWTGEVTVNYEINHCFAVRVPEWAVCEPVPSRESHITFRWVGVDRLDAEVLRPRPLRRLIPQWAEDDAPATAWASTVSSQSAPLRS